MPRRSSIINKKPTFAYEIEESASVSSPSRSLSKSSTKKNHEEERALSSSSSILNTDSSQNDKEDESKKISTMYNTLQVNESIQNIKNELHRVDETDSQVQSSMPRAIEKDNGELTLQDKLQSADTMQAVQPANDQSQPILV